tara:strand:- start:1914 stop:2783 length:870 start_codon:yes stop_codon:yes gene_type:complete
MSYQSKNHLNTTYSESIAEYSPLSTEQELQLSKDVKKGGKKKRAAIHKLMLHNSKLVVKIAGAYINMGLDMDDLVSEGNIGLYEAACRFDPEKGAKFSSYSAFWIKQRMRKALTTKSRNIRVPNSSLEKFNEVIAFINKYEEQNGTKPSVEEIAKGVGSTCNRVNSVVNAALGTLSFDSAVVSERGEGSKENTPNLYHMLEDKTVKPPSEDCLTLESCVMIRKALKKGKLTAREKKVIENRFGFTPTGERQTLEKIGLKLKITRERVRQIELIALFKIKNFLESNNYKK